MKVFKNFFGNNSKISWQEIACKDGNDKSQTLDKFIKNQKILWSGSSYMTNAQTINLSEKISKQKNGIVLIWSAYSGGTAQDYNFSINFIPKIYVSLHASAGIDFSLCTNGFGYIGCKYLYVKDDQISGETNNSKTGTNNGVTYANNHWVLRYVIGV